LNRVKKEQGKKNPSLLFFLANLEGKEERGKTKEGTKPLSSFPH